MTRARLFASVLVAVLVGGAGCVAVEHVGNRCTPEDDARARTIVYRRDGSPAYAGQALLITSCGGGSFCHSEGATGAARFGVPLGLDFDPELADQVADPVHGAARLRRAQLRIFEYRDQIWTAVLDGSMPPPGALGTRVRQAPYVTFDAADARTDAPTLDTDAGRETLRNWLACGAPVIERTGGLGSTTSCSADRDCPLTGICDLRTRACMPIGETSPLRIVPIDPTWSSIYDVVVASRCATGACHGAERPAAGLDFHTEAIALDTLMTTQTSITAACAATGGPLIVPGQPESSLLYRKLTDPEVCGGIMPRGGGQLPPRYTDAIRDWIAALP